MSDSFHQGDIISDYEIIRKIGEGGVGEVYLVRHRFLDALRAMKVIMSTEVFANPVVRERFFREARIASAIRHPNIVEVRNVSQVEDLELSYIVMDYVEGQSLFDRMLQPEVLPFQTALHITCEIAKALDEISRHGVVHRDIKPANIMLAASGEVKLTDLGIAKITRQGELNDIASRDVTLDSVVVGTPAYASPEQNLNANKVDVRSDIYSLGICLYEMLTKQVPFQSESVMGLIEEVLYKEIPPAKSLNPEIPDPLNDLVMRMIARDPDLRPSSPAELIEEIENVSSELQGKKKRESGKPEKNRIALFSAIFAVVFAAFAVWLFIPGNNSPAPVPGKMPGSELPGQTASPDTQEILPEPEEDALGEGGILFSSDLTILKKYPASKQESSCIIPGYVQIIGPGAFANCRNLRNVTIPSSVTEIRERAFAHCRNLVRVRIPSSVKKIAGNAFEGCPCEAEIRKKFKNLMH